MACRRGSSRTLHSTPSRMGCPHRRFDRSYSGPTSMSQNELMNPLASAAFDRVPAPLKISRKRGRRRAGCDTRGQCRTSVVVPSPLLPPTSRSTSARWRCHHRCCLQHHGPHQPVSNLQAAGVVRSPRLGVGTASSRLPIGPAVCPIHSREQGGHGLWPSWAPTSRAIYQPPVM
jgi:hypothetical protein